MKLEREMFHSKCDVSILCLVICLKSIYLSIYLYSSPNKASIFQFTFELESVTDCWHYQECVLDHNAFLYEENYQIVQSGHVPLLKQIQDMASMISGE